MASIDTHLATLSDSDSDRATWRERMVTRNTGLIVRGSVAGSPAKETFYRTDDTAACAGFVTGQTYPVALEQVCAMVFFEAPTSTVLTLRTDESEP